MNDLEKTELMRQVIAPNPHAKHSVPFLKLKDRKHVISPIISVPPFKRTHYDRELTYTYTVKASQEHRRGKAHLKNIEERTFSGC